MKRWLKKHQAGSRSLGVTLSGSNDLYCLKPMCLACLMPVLTLFSCVYLSPIRLSPTRLIFWLRAALDSSHTNRRWTGKEYETDTFSFVPEVPRQNGKDALMVNWCEITTTKEEWTVIYQNAFVTPHLITFATIREIVMDGRSRWKTENENHK